MKMSDSPEPLLGPEEAARLHQRLLDADPIAPNDLAVAYLEPLISWLCAHNRRMDPDFCAEAADRAIVALIQHPSSYRPDRQSLEVYLRMSAQGDLRNLLRKERRHHQRRSPWARVELSPEAGKYLGREDDPSLPLQVAEHQQEALDAVPASVREGLTEAEARVLALMLQKVRKTSVYAEAYGITHLPPKEQAKEMKRVKDRLKKRWERTGGTDEPTP
jgi:hypothetical protein